MKTVLRCISEKRSQREWVPTTAATRRTVLLGFARVAGPDKPLNRVTRRDVDRWVDSKRHVSDSTLRSMLSVVSVFFDWGIDHRLTRTNPARTIRGPHEPPRLPRALTDEQVEKLLASCPTERMRVMVLLQVEMGLRIGEVVSVELGRIDFGRRVLTVRGKGRWERDLPIPGQTFEAMQSYRRALPAPNVGRLIRSEADPLRGITAKYACKLMSELMHATGIDESAHALRHTLATSLADQDVNVRTIQAILGHQKLTSTQRYIGRASLREMRDVLDHRRYPRPKPKPEPPADEPPPPDA